MGSDLLIPFTLSGSSRWCRSKENLILSYPMVYPGSMAPLSPKWWWYMGYGSLSEWMCRVCLNSKAWVSRYQLGLRAE